ncbi:MAG TPA: acetolactate synthase small subunit [Selenomonadales bacterium]|nr:acetolactate synthase small subunit [Selenomonadales bacterium]
MKHVLAILVCNQPGVLVRIAGMFARRGFNIHSLAVGPTQDPAYSRITVVVCGDNETLDQVVKQLGKLLEVAAIQLLPPETTVRCGLAMIKVATGTNRGEVLKLAEVFRASIIDVSDQTVTFEITGEEEKLNAFAELLNPYGILELVRTGLIGLARRTSTIYQYERRLNYEQVVL